MRLDSEFCRLPLRFDAERLANEMAQFSESEWRPHPTDYKGNTALILISSKGEQNDTFQGPMRATPHLDKCPYIQQALSSFQTVFSRSRLMRLAPQSAVPRHSDINYHWYNRVRIHVPIVTYPEVRFFCNDRDVHMAAGEAWIFDTWKMHRVENRSPHTRVHLVADTAGSPEFWNLVARGWQPFDSLHSASADEQFVPYVPGNRVELRTEKFTHQVLMSPGEVDGLAADLIADVRANASATDDDKERFGAIVDNFRSRWRDTWACFGVQQSNWFRYEALLKEVVAKLETIGMSLSLASNGASAVQVFMARILGAAFSSAASEEVVATRVAPQPATKVGRNDPCPCGSGKKYKQCHG
jgi:hypothetical protein